MEPGGTANQVVIVGGGFGGLFAARALANSGFRVTLLDRRNFHTFQPLLYQVATGALGTGDVATPFRLVLRGCGNVNPLMAEAREDNLSRRKDINELHLAEVKKLEEAKQKISQQDAKKKSKIEMPM